MKLFTYFENQMIELDEISFLVNIDELIAFQRFIEISIEEMKVNEQFEHIHMQDIVKKYNLAMPKMKDVLICKDADK